LSSNKPPQTFNGDLHNLPSALDELKLKPNWVLWRWEQKKGRWQKPPYQPNGKRAKTNKPETWSSYPDVMAAFAGSQFDGIGFVLLGSDIGAADLDDCRDIGSGEIGSHAREIMGQIDSYQEVSPSGTGIHIIGTASGAKYDRKVNGVEAYRNSARYITITGNVLNGSGSKLNNIDTFIDAHAKCDTPQSPNHEFINTEELCKRTLSLSNGLSRIISPRDAPCWQVMACLADCHGSIVRRHYVGRAMRRRRRAVLCAGGQ
jgi:primase-polymerase (primpol)-like protein